jgi:hypothetical protein
MCLALGHAVEPATTVRSCAGFCISKEVCHRLGYLLNSSWPGPQCGVVSVTTGGRSQRNHLSGRASHRVDVPPKHTRADLLRSHTPTRSRPARRMPSDPWGRCGDDVPLTWALSCRMVTTVDE